MGFWDLIFKKKPAEKTSTSEPVGDLAADKEQSSDVDLSFSRKYGPVYSSEDLTEEEKAAIRKRIEERYPNFPNKPYLKWDEVALETVLTEWRMRLISTSQEWICFLSDTCKLLCGECWTIF